MKNPAWIKKVRPLRKKPGPKPKPPQDIEMGYIVRMAKGRTGCDAKVWLSESGSCGMSTNLQQATFFSTRETDNINGDAYTRARSYAFWQIGMVYSARKVNGIIEEVCEAHGK